MKLSRAVFGTLVIAAALSGCNNSPTAIAPPAPTPRLDENGGGFGSGNRTLDGAGTGTGTASQGFPTRRDSLVMTAN
jgi:hypothetical protein